MRDIDTTWLEAEDGSWLRLADVNHLRVEEGYGERARVVAVMRYRIGEVDGGRDDRPYVFTLSTHTEREGAVAALRDLMTNALGVLPSYYEASN